MAKLQTLTDSFTTLDVPSKWNTGTSSGTVSLVSGRVKLDVTANGGYAFLRSSTDYELYDSYITAQMVPGAQTMQLQLNPTSGNFAISININGGTSYTVQATNAQGLASIPSTTGTYNATTMAYWRVRHVSASNNAIYIDTSPDGATWTNLATGTGFTISYNYVPLFQQVSTGTAYLDNVNIAANPSITTLTDDFTATSLDLTKWTPTGTVSIVNGELRLTGGSTNPQVVSLNSYAIVNSTAFVKATPATAGTTSFYVQSASTANYAQFYYNQAQNTLSFVASSSANTSYSAQVAYVQSAHQWWQLRLSNGTMFFETSPDSTTWTVRGSVAYNATSSDYKAFLNSQTSSTSAFSTFDNFNVVQVAAYAVTAVPTGINDVDSNGNPSAAWSQTTAVTGTSDTDTVTGPASTYIRQPTGINDGETITAPGAAWSTTSTPTPVTDTDTTSGPTTSYWPLPNSLTEGGSIGTPDVVFMPDKLAPGNITDVGPVGTPSVEFKTFYTGGYGQGTYGGALYSQFWIGPDPITNTEEFGLPDVGNRPIIGVGNIIDGEIVGTPVIGGAATGTSPMPAGVPDTETLGTPTLTFVGSDLYGLGLYGGGVYNVGQQGQVQEAPTEYGTPSNYGYGAGIYGDKTYTGTAGTTTDLNPTDNNTYGSGTYDYGIYYGQAITLTNPVPLFTNIAGTTRPPLHILGIGPWSPVIEWRGAANYGVVKGSQPSRPAMPMPKTTSKGFTLRLNEGSEARAEINMARGSAIIIDEMDTDLWWRRKDPRTKTLEVIGRFNTAHSTVSTSDTGVNVSLQFDDYRTVLSARMVLKYKDPKAAGGPTSQFKDDVIDVLKFALPDNTRLDLSEVFGPTPYNLGKLTLPYQLPPGTTIGEVMEQLVALSPIRWEWWIETPADVTKAPKLMFQLGTRGLDKGVVLHDLGKGPSPIASWTRNAAADNYANSLVYNGSDGGTVVQFPAQIAQYGQRDAEASNNTIDGTHKRLLDLSAKRKLEKLAQRQATYTINLANGFWRGRSHIDIGDTVTLIIRLGKEQILEKYRVTELSCDIDDNGSEEVTLTLGRPLSASDPRSKQSPLLRIIRSLKQFTPLTGDLDVTQAEPVTDY